MCSPWVITRWPARASTSAAGSSAGMTSTSPEPAATAARPSRTDRASSCGRPARSASDASRQAMSARSTGAPGAAGITSSSSSMRFSRARNSSLRNMSLMPERSGGSATSAAKSTSISSAAVDGRERLALDGVVDVVAQRLAALLAGHLVEVGVDALEAAELHQQVGGGLLTDAGNPGDVVGGVALEADEVGYLGGVDAVALADPLGGVDDHVGDAARRHHDADVVGGQLEGVAIG